MNSSSLQSDHRRVCHQRILQVFDYLKALNDHRNPAVRRVQEQSWFMWLDNLPDHPSIELQSPSATTSGDDDDDEESTRAYVLRVRRPKLTPSPQPPGEVRDWLRAGWDEPANDVQWQETQNRIDEEGETITISFDDEPERLAALARWRQKRDAWREAEIPARRAMQVFERLCNKRIDGTRRRKIRRCSATGAGRPFAAGRL